MRTRSQARQHGVGLVAYFAIALIGLGISGGVYAFWHHYTSLLTAKATAEQLHADALGALGEQEMENQRLRDDILARDKALLQRDATHRQLEAQRRTLDAELAELRKRPDVARWMDDPIPDALLERLRRPAAGAGSGDQDRTRVPTGDSQPTDSAAPIQRQHERGLAEVRGGAAGCALELQRGQGSVEFLEKVDAGQGGTMSGRIRCFWLDPVERYEFSLRRYTFSSGDAGKCAASGLGYHNASAVLGQAGIEQCPMVREGKPVHGDHWPHDDARWPARCACGYTFVLGDEWQFNPDQLFKRSDGGELVTLRGAPAGAMYDAHWMTGSGYKRLDGVTLVVKTPAGEWCVDGPSYDGGKISGPGWTRSGRIPDVTAQPSIHFPGQYHGWLTEGWLISC